ncbi:Tip attachment protein J [uncultured Caudovirales phage]|uniref:Tip attachment protein J n=1 Tax=uncultured Caudovirales phage TaxID=2100421 RepID=A0A6J5N921_9CAUD|nr:Tip attachment protein J [uncultured Caudovirales phage]
MSTLIPDVFAINGLIDTNQSALKNIQALASAAGTWVTYDVNAGLWSMIINQAGTSIKSFDDDNIIGSITMGSTGITELYNSVEIEFPHKDLTDQKDYIKFSIPETDRYPNEPDNMLSIQFDCINNPVQAELLASRELKQSRVDKVVEFRTDYSSIGLKAGDLIDLTSDMFGYTNKVFRVIKIIEDDASDGIFTLSITALEYDAGVYDTNGLVREERTNNNGITNKTLNTAINTLDQEAQLSQPLSILRAFQVPGNDNGLNIPVGTSVISFGQQIVLPYNGNYKVSYTINWGSNLSGGVSTGVIKLSTIRLTSGPAFGTGSPLNLGKWASTGDQHSQIYEDHFLQGFFTGTKGQIINFGIEASTNLGPGAQFYVINNSGQVAVLTAPTGTAVSIWVQVELYLLQRTY